MVIGTVVLVLLLWAVRSGRSDWSMIDGKSSASIESGSGSTMRAENTLDSNVHIMQKAYT